MDPRPLAVHVRDALGLDTAADDLSPPPLVHRPADRSALLDAGELRQAGQDWPAWWRAIIGFDARFHGAGPTADFLAWYRPFAAERAGAVGAPPDFAALAPALRRAVVALYPEARPGPDDGAVDDPRGAWWELVGEVAAEVAGRHRVSVGEVRGVVLALPVEGSWWRVAEPGVLVCSTSCLERTEPATVIVREVFESGFAS